MDSSFDKRTVSVEEIKKYKASHTNDEMFETFTEFINDCKTLVDRMYDLYRENDVLLALSNVKISVQIKAFDDTDVLSILLGADVLDDEEDVDDEE